MCLSVCAMCLLCYRVHFLTNTHTHTRTHACTHTHAHMHTHTCTHAHASTHTHTHIHIHISHIKTAWNQEEEDQEDAQLWEDNWDDDDVDEQFSLQLRQELEKTKGKHTHNGCCWFGQIVVRYLVVVLSCKLIGVNVSRVLFFICYINLG